jgi:hypothetical protein
MKCIHPYMLQKPVSLDYFLKRTPPFKFIISNRERPPCRCVWRGYRLTKVYTIILQSMINSVSRESTTKKRETRQKKPTVSQYYTRTRHINRKRAASSVPEIKKNHIPSSERGRYGTRTQVLPGRQQRPRVRFVQHTLIYKRWDYLQGTKLLNNSVHHHSSLNLVVFFLGFPRSNRESVPVQQSVSRTTSLMFSISSNTEESKIPGFLYKQLQHHWRPSRKPRHDDGSAYRSRHLLHQLSFDRWLEICK